MLCLAAILMVPHYSPDGYGGMPPVPPRFFMSAKATVRFDYPGEESAKEGYPTSIVSSYCLCTHLRRS